MPSAHTVLVVEDDPVAATITTRFLEHLDCTTLTADSAKGAEQILEDMEVQLVLSDVLLAGGPDTGMANAYREAATTGGWATPPRLVAVSGDALGSDPDAYRRIGFDDYLPKPVDFQRLRDLVASLDATAAADGMQEVVVELGLGDDVQSQLKLHSFLNLLNILLGEFQLFRLDLEQPDALPRSMALVSETLEAIRGGSIGEALATRLLELDDVFDEEIGAARRAVPEEVSDAAKASVENTRTVINVLGVRLGEYLNWTDGGLGWQRHSLTELKEKLLGFFGAVEKNSKGGYNIVYNIATREPSDYLVNLEVEGENGDDLIMPPILQDVFRDLLANSRKYTPPGGEIIGGLAKRGDSLRIVVEDTGIGIPAGELDRVVEFGYRASNARGRRTQGDGFGLTKAYEVTRQLGGRFLIRSELGQGTRVQISIPVPPEYRTEKSSG